MKNRIIEIAKAEKISDVGFCNISDYKKEAMNLPTAAFSSRKEEETEIIKNARTAIVCAFNYYAGDEKGNISRYAQGEDYHFIVREKMRPIAEELEKTGFFAKIYSDTGVLNERLLAGLSGIAFVGRNGMAINEKCGSYFFLGYILTDCEITDSRMTRDGCLGCGKCERACPTGALTGGFCEEKCISYITQKKGELSDFEEQALINAHTVWGCDVCQEVCPHNSGIPLTEIAEFYENRLINLEIDENISNKQFQNMYKNRAFAWRGKAVLVRNQKIIKKSEKK